jgi:hypothetical protein
MAKSKLRDSAKGQECQIRLYQVCNGDNTTTCLAHLGGGGMGMKKNDIHGSFSCSSCHDAVDGRLKTGYSYTELELWHHEGVERTQDIWLKSGLIGVK